MTLNAIKLTKPQFWPLSILPALAGLHIAAGFFPLFQTALVVLAAASLSALVEIVNNWSDRVSDARQVIKKVAGVTVAGGSGMDVTAQPGFVFFVGLASVVIAGISSSLLGTNTFIVAVIGATLAFCYSVPPVQLKCRGIIGLLTIGGFRGCISLLIGFLAWPHAGNEWIVPALYISLLITGTATIPHLLDYREDKASKISTFPVAAGYQTAARIAGAFIITSTAFMLAAAISGIAATNILSIPVSVVSLLAGAALLDKRHNDPENVIRMVPLAFAAALGSPLVFL